MGPFVPKNTATIFPKTATSKLAPLHTQSITVPPQAKTVALKTWIHGYMIPHYGKYFGGTGYVGNDCIRLFEDGQRIELHDIMDSPDFTPETEWTFPVN